MNIDPIEFISLALMIGPATVFALIVIWLGVSDRWKAMTKTWCAHIHRNCDYFPAGWRWIIRVDVKDYHRGWYVVPAIWQYCPRCGRKRPALGVRK